MNIQSAAVTLTPSGTGKIVTKANCHSIHNIFNMYNANWGLHYLSLKAIVTLTAVSTTQVVFKKLFAYSDSFCNSQLAIHTVKDELLG